MENHRYKKYISTKAGVAAERMKRMLDSDLSSDVWKNAVRDLFSTIAGVTICISTSKTHPGCPIFKTYRGSKDNDQVTVVVFNSEKELESKLVEMLDTGCSKEISRDGNPWCKRHTVKSIIHIYKDLIEEQLLMEMIGLENDTQTAEKFVAGILEKTPPDATIRNAQTEGIDEYADDPKQDSLPTCKVPNVEQLAKLHAGDSVCLRRNNGERFWPMVFHIIKDKCDLFNSVFVGVYGDQYIVFRAFNIYRRGSTFKTVQDRFNRTTVYGKRQEMKKLLSW